MAGLQKSYYGGTTQGYQLAVAGGRNNSLKSHPPPSSYHHTSPVMSSYTPHWHCTVQRTKGCLGTEDSRSPNKAVNLLSAQYNSVDGGSAASCLEIFVLLSLIARGQRAQLSQ